MAEKNETKKSNGEQSGLCDLEQVTLKPQLQVHHYLTTWLQIWYHSLLWGDSIRKGADLEKQNCLFGVHPAVMGKFTSLLKIHFGKQLFEKKEEGIVKPIGSESYFHQKPIRMFCSLFLFSDPTF